MDYVWKVVRKIKLGVSFGKTCSSDALYKDIDSNIDEVERILEVTASDERFGNVTDSSLKTAADMFLYLNSCNENLRPWFIFYTDLIRNKSPNEIILTLNRILKNRNNFAEKDLIDIARKLFDKLSSTFTMQFQDIQSYTSCTGNDSLNGLTKGDLNNFKIKLKHDIRRFNLGKSSCSFGLWRRAEIITFCFHTILRIWRKHVSHGNKD